MSAENMLSNAIDTIVKLSYTQGADFIDIPTDAIPPGLVIENPQALVTMRGDGSVKVESIKPLVDELRGKPALRAGSASVFTLKSFIDLVNRHATTDTAIFVDPNWEAPSLLAVIDYHSPRWTEEAEIDRPASIAGDDAGARFGRHRISYAFPLSDPWKTWRKLDAEWMSQDEFARFLEEHINELASPSQAEANDMLHTFKMKVGSPNEIIDLARGLELNVNSRVASKTNLASGERTLVFDSQHVDAENKKVDVPGLFMLSIPIFYGSEEQRLPVRLRYRVSSGTLVWAYEILRPDIYIDERVQADKDKIAAGTCLPVYDGIPEAAV